MLSRNDNPAVEFNAGADGLAIRAVYGDRAAARRLAGELPHAHYRVPFQALNDCQGGRDHSVELTEAGDDQVRLAWTDKGVPQQSVYHVPDVGPEFPPSPSLDNWTPQPDGFLPALHAALQTTDSSPLRYSTDFVQFDGNRNRLVATDARHGLIQEGFDFSWDDKPLVPRTTVFGSKELESDGPVVLARHGEWLAIRVGCWTFWLHMELEARFPDIDGAVRAEGFKTGLLHLHADDSKFLAESLPRLPRYEDDDSPSVTVDLNGEAVIRARGRDADAPLTELVLSRSTCEGGAVRINTDRSYLQRAVELGFERIAFANDVPVVCRDGSRTYLWALLSGESALEPADNTVRIDSAANQAPTAKPTPPKPRRKRRMNTNSNGRSNGQQNGTRSTTSRNGTNSDSEAAGIEDLLVQAEQLKTALSEARSQTNSLIANLKKHRRQNRLVQSTLRSLRELQSTGL